MQPTPLRISMVPMRSTQAKGKTWGKCAESHIWKLVVAHVSAIMAREEMYGEKPPPFGDSLSVTMT